MKILAIETSCDETAIAVLETSEEGSFNILANFVASQVKIHKKWGGVHPALAKREHQKNLAPLFKKALKKAKSEIDLIAVTQGPGLDPCLWTGINFVKDLSSVRQIPVVGINHVEAHILVNFLKKKENTLPAVALIASGGHTQLILVKKIGDYKVLGQTKDDAAGECFDKTARVLGLEYPGGPAIERAAKKLKKRTIKMPRPMINSQDYNFSFSGLKTAVLYHHKKQGSKDKRYIAEMAYEIQQSVIDVLISKTTKAAREYKTKNIILGGGVTANKELRKQFKKTGFNVIVPNPQFSTDNAVMTAITGFYHRKEATKDPRQLEAKPNLKVE